MKAGPVEQTSQIEILTPDECAARLKVKKCFLYDQMRQTKKNPIPVIRVGRFLRFDWQQVYAWLRQNQSFGGHKPTPQKKMRSAAA